MSKAILEKYDNWLEILKNDFPERDVKNLLHLVNEYGTENLINALEKIQEVE